MALQTAWWMQPQPSRCEHLPPENLPPELQHLQWPWSWHPDLIGHRNIEAVLEKSKGTMCSIESYRCTPTQIPLWEHQGHANTNEDLISLLRRQCVSVYPDIINTCRANANVRGLPPAYSST